MGDREFYQRLTDLKTRHQQTLNFCEQLFFKQQANRRLNLQNPTEPVVVRGAADAGPLVIPRPSNIGAHRAITKLTSALRGKQPVAPSRKAPAHLSSGNDQRVKQQLSEESSGRPFDASIVQDSLRYSGSLSSDADAYSLSSGDVSPNRTPSADLKNASREWDMGSTQVADSPLERSDSAHSLPDTARDRERLFRAPLVSNYPNANRTAAQPERSSKPLAERSTRSLRQRSNSANGRVPAHRHRPELWNNGLRPTASTMEELLDKYVGTGDDWHHRLTIPRPFTMTKREERNDTKSRRQKFIEEVFSHSTTRTRAVLHCISLERNCTQELARKREAEERECRVKFHAQPPPAHIYVPLYDELCEKAEARRRFVREYSKSLLQSLEKPFNFWLRERAREATGETSDAIRRHHHWYLYLLV